MSRAAPDAAAPPNAAAPNAAAPGRVIAADWSGAVAGAERKIWLCEVAGGRVARLENGRSRAALAAEVRRVGEADPSLVAGFDFAFSLPAWFFAQRRVPSARALWALATQDGPAWLSAAEPPFWGPNGTRKPVLPAHTRRTEDEAAARSGRRPSSVFKLVGADQVGRGSVRGMAELLAALPVDAWTVWPFDDPVPGRPTAVEIWPRLLYAGPVVKARADARAAYLDRHLGDLAADVRAAAVASDDAFDALTAAAAMWAHRDELAALPPARDAAERLEGRIWAPAA